MFDHGLQYLSSFDILADRSKDVKKLDKVA